MTRLSCSLIHTMFQLKESLSAFGVHIIRDRGTTEPDCVFEDLAQNNSQFLQLGPRQPARSATRPNPCTKQAFIRVDVSHSGHQRLVQERGLDCQLPSSKQCRKLIRSDREWLRARSRES